MLIVFFCGALCSAASLAGYVQAAESKGFATSVLVPNTSPFTSNHAVELERMRDVVGKEAERVERDTGKTPGLGFFAYSGGAKFAARLAQDTRVEGLFLVDPVDGPPPGNRQGPRFPVFLEDATPEWRMLGRSSDGMRTPALLRILSTELGEQPGFTGTPCVTPSYGSRFFAERLGAQQEESTEIPNSGHLDVLFRGAGLLGTVCPRGSDPAAARAQSLAEFEFFLAQLSTWVAR